MVDFYIVRSEPHDPENLKKSFAHAFQLASKSTKLVTVLLPMIKQGSAFGLDKVLGEAGLKQLDSKRILNIEDVTFVLKCDKTIKSNDDNGVVLALSCPVQMLHKFESAWKTKALIAMTFGLTELDQWAKNVGAKKL
ncbi:hypothetical protein [Shewanella scandinavica]|uniref:Uncharacterized protein n=1 Tax=Shewanella scandinavica TaxID=3063538 RepID=A0ABU3G269_9GAMM|nr:hypothetical protein [Shewanella sp. SP2S1-2]MDT3281726.1 hypothetical protein [Shewanella sp. SP2S1-2]